MSVFIAHKLPQLEHVGEMLLEAILHFRHFYYINPQASSVLDFALCYQDYRLTVRLKEGHPFDLRSVVCTFSHISGMHGVLSPTPMVQIPRQYDSQMTVLDEIVSLSSRHVSHQTSWLVPAVVFNLPIYINSAVRAWAPGPCVNYFDDEGIT